MILKILREREKYVNFIIRAKPPDNSKNIFFICIRLMSRKWKAWASHRAIIFDIFSQRIFLEYTLPDTRRERKRGRTWGGKGWGWAGGIGGCGEEPVSVSLFAFCLPAEHPGVQKRPGSDRTAETYRRQTWSRTAALRQPSFPSPSPFPPESASRPRPRSDDTQRGKSEWNYLYARTWFR